MKPVNHQHIIRSYDVQTSVENGLNIISHLLKESYGPFGKNILFDEKKKGIPDLFKNGGKICRLLQTKNQIENLIFLLLEDSFQKVNNLSADGTKTFFLISSFIILSGFKALTQNSDRTEIIAGIKKTLNYALFLLNEKSQPIKSETFWDNILSTYLPSEKGISTLFQEAYKKVGKSGQITIREEIGNINQITIQRGMQVERGYLSPYFVTDVKKMTVEFENPFLLICNQKVTFEDGILIRLLEKLIFEKRPLLIMSPDIDDVALSTLILNKVNGVLDLVYIKIPEDFNSQKFILEDLALYTNAKYIKYDRDWRTLKYSDLGQADKIIVSKTKTTIWANNSFKEKEIEKKCQELKQQILVSDSDYENEKKEERRKNFQGSNAFITIGGITDFETSNLKLRSEMGLIGAKSCLYEGVLPGGGVTLFQASEEIENWSRINLYGPSFTGSKLVVNALLVPIKTLLSSKKDNNDLIKKSNQIFEKLRTQNPYSFSYDIYQDDIKELKDSGVIDSFKSLKVGLQTSKALTTSILSIANLVI